MGLILSTRSIVLTVMCPYLVFIGIHKTGLKKISLWVIGIIMGFTATFLPIIFFQGFFPSNNPFAIQNIFLPLWLPIIVLLLMGWRKLSDMPVLMKKLRLQEHIKWAAENESLDASYKASSRDITIIRCP